VVDDAASRERRDMERALAQQIVSWYVAASKNVQRQRKGLHAPSDKDALPIARLILQFRDTYHKQGFSDPVGEHELALLGEVYGHVHNLLKCLPLLRDIYARGGGIDCREVRAIEARLPLTRTLAPTLKEYLVQAQALAADLHLDSPPAPGTRGRRRALINVWAHALLPSVRAAWRACGWQGNLSASTPDGPVVEIMCAALEAVDGREHGAATVSDVLADRRRLRKGRGKSD
jgi:hypothetical protein